MSRTVTASLRRELEKQESAEALICFVTISHPDLSTVIRVVSDPYDHTWNSNTYTGVMFDWQMVTDNDRPPSTRFVVQNVDRIVGKYVRPLTKPPRVQIDLLKASDFNNTVDPRTPIGSPSAEYTAERLFMFNVEGNTLDVSAELRGWDFTQEIWPGNRATESNFPGLYA